VEGADPAVKRFVDFTVERFYGQRLVVLLLLHIALIVLSNQAAFWLRFDGDVPPEQQPFDWELVPLLVIVRLAFFIPMRLHEGVWRYASIWDLRKIVVGVVLSSVAFWAIVHGMLGILLYPRSVFIVDSLLLIFMAGGVRMARRLYASSGRRGRERRVLIYGAGDAGEMIARDLLEHPSEPLPVAFLDDNPQMRGAQIHGVPVLGGAEALQRALELTHPTEILIAMPGADPKTLRRVVTALQSCALPLRTLPRLREIPTGEVSIAEVRDLSVADLLTRAPVGLDPARLSELIEGQTVLVTGAGGSIGSELCRQILAVGPRRLVLLDRYENSLFAIHAELCQRSPQHSLGVVIADITDAHRIEQVFAAENPHVVFHAAAHKHVPLMEANPCEAVKNNVRGTRIVADAALKAGAARFVLISTDKAVNPTSVMGATKRMAETMIERRAALGPTRFMAVRFGNVLGSNGSVVPTFVEQIKAGGPVTVTHPEMRRYFMLIPEAVQLVLHAAAIGERGIYVLDMGEQVRVVDMARDLIRLAGYVPDKDVEISYTGMRPGEKLFEELVGPDEQAEPSVVDKVQRVYPVEAVSEPSFELSVSQIEQLAAAGDEAGVVQFLAARYPSLSSHAAQARIAV
jgi:FlaA1/EpsC-like NDP-sugar epimerase